MKSVRTRGCKVQNVVMESKGTLPQAVRNPITGSCGTNWCWGCGTGRYRAASR